MAFNEKLKGTLLAALQEPLTTAASDDVEKFDQFKGELIRLCDLLIEEESEETWQALFSLNLSAFLRRSEKSIMLKLQDAHDKFNANPDEADTVVLSSPAGQTTHQLTLTPGASSKSNDSEDWARYSDESEERSTKGYFDFEDMANNPEIFFAKRIYNGATIDPKIPQPDFAMNQWKIS